VQFVEGGRKILLANNIGGEADMLWPIRLHCVGVWISGWNPCIYICC